MNVLSLFDGISCGMVALERAGIQVDNYFASETDQNAIKVSKSNYPNIIQLGDVRGIDIDKLKELPEIDLLIGGSPCQGFSRAGKGLNFEDPRSKLFFEYVRILNELRRINPDIKFLLENVKMKNEWKDIISKYIGVEGIEINSKLVSAQNRLRVYWTNINFDVPKDKNIKLLDILDDFDSSGFVYENGILFDPSISDNSRKLVSIVDSEIRIKQAVKKGYIVANNGDGINLAFPKSVSRRGRVIKEKSSTLDCACNICVYHNGAIRRYSIEEMEKLQTLPIGYTKIVNNNARKKTIGNGWTVDIIAHILKGLK